MQVGLTLILIENFDFQAHLSTFRADNTHKSWHFKSENNSQTLPKPHQTRLQKVQKTTFFTPKSSKITLTNVKSWLNFDIKS